MRLYRNRNTEDMPPISSGPRLAHENSLYPPLIASIDALDLPFSGFFRENPNQYPVRVCLMGRSALISWGMLIFANPNSSSITYSPTQSIDNHTADSIGQTTSWSTSRAYKTHKRSCASIQQSIAITC